MFRFLRNMATCMAILTAAHLAWAVVAQQPLLNKTINVKPNIALVLDTSSSMAFECVYAKHVVDAFIKENPTLSNRVGECLVDSNQSLLLTDIRNVSPVNNLLFYDPKTTYGPGYVGGTLQTKATVDNSSVVVVYLPVPPKDPTTYTTSSAITNASNYEKYEVTSTSFKKNSINTTRNANPFGDHGGGRTDCLYTGSDPCTFAQERQNIANWRKWHSSRIKAAKTGLSGAFTAQGDNFRLAYGTIYDSPNTMQDFGLKKAAFFSWLDGLAPTNDKPLRAALDKAGKYYQDTANTGPWGSRPWSPPAGEKAADHLSCRRSYTIMMTDGFYNDGQPSDIGDEDSKLGTQYTYVPDPSKTYQYAPGNASDVRNKGKSDNPDGKTGYSGTLADIALKYWATDLRDLKNDNGKGNPSDPPFWQNMTSYMVSFGALGLMTEADVTKAKAGTLSWKRPTLNQITTIDDMRHAAHNGGGDFLTVTDAQQFTTELGNLIGSISGQQLSQAGVAASAVTLTTGTKKFVPYYTSDAWWGNLQMVNLTATGNNRGLAWQVIATDANGQPTGVTTLPTPVSRNIVVWVNGMTQAVDFTNININASVNSLKGTNTNMQMSNAVTSDIVDFLRGVRTKEGRGFRKRLAVLGDIVNGTPTFIKNNTAPEYEKLPSTTPGLPAYAAYMTAKAARTEGVLFVGANDGMLHAFGEGAGTKVGGREIFAYVPRSVLGKLEGLSSFAYSSAHTYTVDGPLSETDAYVTTPNPTTVGASIGWKNLVIGTTGAGAKAVFALNVSDPLGMNNKSVLWEINPDPAFPVLVGNTATSFQELGHVLSPVQSGITASGDWVSIFGNGYDSKTGQASLFVVESGSGKLIKQISTDSTVGNGLGGVRLVLNAKQQIIGAYAGDLKGRLWKFDLSSTSASGWILVNGGAALFTAMNGSTPLPITAQPGVMERIDQAGYVPSYLVSIATGKLFEATDPTATSPAQAAFGLWDRKAFGSTGADSIVESQLEGLRAGLSTAGIDPTAGATLNAGGTASFYTVGSSTPTVTNIDWALRRGWKLNLDVFAGQRTIYPVQMLGEVVKIDTIVPDVSTSSCKAESSNALSFYINPLTGACRTGGTLDTNADGKIDTSDANVCAHTSQADGMDVVLIVTPNIRDVQNSGGHITIRVKDDSDPPKCTDSAYAVAHELECKCGDTAYAASHVEACTTPDCHSAVYRAAHPGVCSGSTLKRSWRQLFPRAN